MNAAFLSNTTRCERCGAWSGALRPDGLCTRCLLASALASGDESAADIGDAAVDAPQQIGRYRLLAEIDRGGVGVVYRALQSDLRREVALKMLLPARVEAKDARDRFRREAEAMASLDHPGILPVYEVGVHDGLPYFSMKLAEGGNLAQRIAELHGCFRECARVLALIARAIAHAHARGVLHRDLKPSNIVFGADQPMVTDFGLARFFARESSLTGIDTVIGTPRYVAPEVVASAGAHLTPAADVYGLGAILYELLSGRAPFAELTSLQILQQIATRRPREPRQFDAAIPAALEAICLRCMEKRPADRYVSADALASALETWLAGTQPRGFVPHWLKLQLPSRRRRAVAATMFVLVAALTAAAIGYASREPIPIPDPASATRSVVVVTDLLKNSPSEREAARSLAAHLQLSPPLRLLPFESSLAIAKSTAQTFDADTDVDAAVGAFLVVAVEEQRDGQFALMVADDLREERFYETTFTPAEEDRVAREVAAALAEKRGQPATESHLSRSALASLLRARRLLQSPKEGTNAQAIAALKDTIEKAPDSAVAHAWLADAYMERGGETFWTDSAIDEAARAQRMDPSLGLAAKQLGVAYQQKSWFARATTAYELARALGSLYLENSLGWIYYTTGRFDDSYRMCLERQRFGTDDPFPQVLAAHVLFAVGENDAGQRAMRIAIAQESRPVIRSLQEAEIAWYRHDYTRCRELAGAIDPQTGDSYFTPSSLVRSCAIEQGDFAAALATMDATKRAYASDQGSPNGNNPALREAILLAQLNRRSDVPALLEQARQGLQAAIDSSSDYPPVWLRMAAAQRLAGDVDTAYATLEHAFALGLTINNRNRADVEFLPFRGDARFESLKATAEAYVVKQRKAVAELVISIGEPSNSALSRN